MDESKYCDPQFTVSYDRVIALKYLPIIFDPYGYAKGNNPALYYRIVESHNTIKCIQYYYYWDKQDCNKDYIIAEPNAVGSILGIVFAVVGCVVSEVLKMLFPSLPTMWLLQPWWAQFIKFIVLFLIGAWIGYRYHNEINDLKIFQLIAGQTVGRFFTHNHDFEPIMIFLNDQKIEKVVLSGRGNFESQPHRNDIFGSQDDYTSDGKCIFSTSMKPFYPKGKHTSKTVFRDYRMSELSFEEDYHPKFALITCYHVFTGQSIYFGEPVFKHRFNFSLRVLSDDILDEWYAKGLGHDVSNPFSFPHIKFWGKTNKGRESILLLLEAVSLLMAGMVMIRDAVISLVISNKDVNNLD